MAAGRALSRVDAVHGCAGGTLPWTRANGDGRRRWWRFDDGGRTCGGHRGAVWRPAVRGVLTELDGDLIEIKHDHKYK